jgi:hypothetical protein
MWREREDRTQKNLNKWAMNDTDKMMTMKISRNKDSSFFYNAWNTDAISF